MNFVLLLMLDSWRTVLKSLKSDAKAAKFVSLTLKFSSVPRVEISENREAFCSRAPFHDFDVVVFLEVKTEFLVGSCDVLETTLSSLENFKPPGK